jgi:hypothetical protein
MGYERDEVSAELVDLVPSSYETDAVCDVFGAHRPGIRPV